MSTPAKSRQRIIDHGEVFTPPALVNAMLDLVAGECERIDSRFLEPACGDGNFLAEVLRRKLQTVTERNACSRPKWEHGAILAISSLYGIDLLADNVAAKIVRGVTGPRADDLRARVRVIPNFVDTTHIQPSERENAYRREFDLVGRQVVMYAGNVGFSQSLDLVIDAAVALADDPDVAFVIHGGGAARESLQQRAQGLANVRFVPMQPKERLPEVLAAADIHVVPLRRGLARSSVPSKLYSILAAGRPVVASVDPGTEVERTLAEAGAGVAVPPEDPVAFTAAVRSLLGDRGRAAAMGRAGRAFVEDWASPAAIAERYEELFDEVRAGRGRGRG